MPVCNARSIRRDVTIRAGAGEDFVSFVIKTINDAMETGGLYDESVETLTPMDYMSLFSIALRATGAPNLHRHYRELEILTKEEYKTKPVEDELNDVQLPAFIAAVGDEIRTELDLGKLAHRFKEVFPNESSTKDKLCKGRFIVHTIMYRIMKYLRNRLINAREEFTAPNVEKFLELHHVFKYRGTLQRFADSVGTPENGKCYSTVKILTTVVLAYTLSVAMGFQSSVITGIFNNTIFRKVLKNRRTVSNAAAGSPATANAEQEEAKAVNTAKPERPADRSSKVFTHASRAEPVPPPDSAAKDDAESGKTNMQKIIKYFARIDNPTDILDRPQNPAEAAVATPPPPTVFKHHHQLG